MNGQEYVSRRIAEVTDPASAMTGPQRAVARMQIHGAIQALTATGMLTVQQAVELQSNLDGEPPDPALAALALTATPTGRRDLVLAAAAARSTRTRPDGPPDLQRPELVRVVAVAVADQVHHQAGPPVQPTSMEIWNDRIVIHLADPDAPAGGPLRHRRWNVTDDQGNRYVELACHGWDSAGVYTQARVFTPGPTAPVRNLAVNHDAADGEPSFTIMLG